MLCHQTPKLLYRLASCCVAGDDVDGPVLVCQAHPYEACVQRGGVEAMYTSSECLVKSDLRREGL
eukprot:4680473-Amphidinium_carterae.1